MVPWLQTKTRQRAAIPPREFTMPQGPGSAPRIPLLKRAVILALNWHAELSFDAIAVKVHGNSRTARRIGNGQKYKHFSTNNRCIIHGGNDNFDG